MLGLCASGPHDLAEARALDDEPQHHADDNRNADEEEVEWRHHAAGDEDRRHLEYCRHAHGTKLGAPNDLHHVVEDKNEAIADEQLHQHVRAVNPTHKQSLKYQADERGAECRTEQRYHVAVGQLEDGESEVSPQHVEGAVGEIDDLQHAEN